MHVKSIRQTEAAECGLACLAIASGMLGAQRELSELRRKHPVSNRGLTLDQIMIIASAMQMTSRPLKCELEELRELASPSILHWGLNHFVVLIKATRTHVTIQDPANGVRRLPIKEVSQRFTGIALELSRAPAFQRRKDRSPLKLTSLFQMTPVIVGGLAQVLILSLLLQAYVVASPFYMQLAIDEAALKGDEGLLVALALGFGLFGLFNVGATALRGVALQKMSALLGWDMTGRLFHHMLRLPLPWFQRRRLADTLSRFESIEPVRALFANGLVSSLIDGLLAVVTLVMMIVFAWKLALVAAAGVVAYVVIRLVSIPLTIQLAGDALVASIAEQGKRIETIRAIQTIKVMGAESQREGDWSNRFAETIRTGQRNAFANIGFSSVQGVTDAVANVALIYLGAAAVIDNTMTVGVLYAFMAYKGQFTSRVQGLFETFINWRMLDLHSDRIADIALTSVEKGIDDAGVGLLQMEGAIELRNLAFQYAPQEPVVFQGVNLRVEPGEFIAVVGPSGGGKSTLIKVLCGLYPSVAGEVRIDGLPLSAWGPRTVRRNLGVVMQDDELISGSIAENVAFFAEDVDMDWAWKCLAMASIDEEVRAMPMRAETFVGDMGSSLSGGQKQRILLARALYRRPKILILDEATSHLDIARERSINDALKAQTITRIVVAHRPETIAAADRVVVLQNGRLIEPQKAPVTLQTAPSGAA
ncbi:peptidase domain-containing ABC transporter [Brevundimonas sp.]|uniref:peptidase domain-containing ABC transporter n=1 Tax=Brevundimonas sp. TaxID=1871086 RepID=UPI002D80A57F|nr:peptidase domain-containing ABC transporter [Brevundimonas sp.]